MILEGKVLKIEKTDKGISYFKVKTSEGIERVEFPRDFSKIERKAILKQDVRYEHINLNKQVFKKPDTICLTNKYSLIILTGSSKGKKFKIQSGVIGYKDNNIFSYNNK